MEPTNTNTEAESRPRVPPAILYECRCPLVPEKEGDRDLGDEISEIMEAYPDAAVMIAFQTPGVTTKKEAADWIKARPTLRSGDVFHILTPRDTVDVGNLRPTLSSRNAKPRDPNAPKRERKPRDPNAPPAKRGRKPKNPPADASAAAPAAPASVPKPAAAPAQASGKPAFGGKRR